MTDDTPEIAGRGKSDWRGIETAPKDGQWIFGRYDDGFVLVIGWRAFQDAWVDRECELPVKPPSHWKPLED